MRRLVTILILLAAIGGGAWWRFGPHAATTAATARRNQRPDTIPVVVTAAARRDVPIYLEGLGTAQASANVTVKAQVDGALSQVLFREGQDVRAGDVLAKIDPRSYQATLDQAMGKQRQDAANLANARVDLARYAKLSANAYTSVQQADTQKAMVAQLEAQVAQDQAQIDSARTQLGFTTVVAPIDGRVGIRLVDAGNIVHASDATGLVVITTLKPISVVFTLPQQALAAVSQAMRAGAPEVIALPQNNVQDELDRGTLIVLDNQVDQTTGTIKLKASFPNDRLQLWPGAFLTVRLKVDTAHDAIVVPPVAVQRGPEGAYVYVIGAGDIAERRLVKVGHEDQLASIVTDGLQPGERVVVDGAARLSDKSKASIVQPGINPAPPEQPTPPAQGRGTASRQRNTGAT